eukprot:TRINITY_DN806_c1_g1_i6.p1 TRINITY_DN806_c1_g1~~TRINITY_DN806_c1_g1_i6.p1  ORF type:complete len:643 (+),score=181.00 TRINITY_DN806_c1_g1_i6:269-1930(+)
MEPWDAQYRPTRVRFSSAAPQRKGALNFIIYSFTSGNCVEMAYDHTTGQVKANYKPLLQRMEHLRWYSFDLVLDWGAKTVRWMVDGQEVLQTALGCDYMEAIRFDTSPVHNKRIGAQDTPLYLDDVSFDCYGSGIPAPSPVVGSTPTPVHVPSAPPTPIPVSAGHRCQGNYRGVYGPQPGTLTYAGDASGLQCWHLVCPGGQMYLRWKGVSLRSQLSMTDVSGKETVSWSPSDDWVRRSLTLLLDSAAGSKFSVSWKCNTHEGETGPGPAPVPVTRPPPSRVCRDLTLPNGQGWHELGNVGYGCKYYEETAGACAQYGNHYRHTHTANEACCVCGGGSTRQTPKPAPVPAPAPAPVPQPAQCTDMQTGGKAWHHQGHSYYTCEWYASDKSRCTRYGTHYRNRYVANEACCVCGGGSTAAGVTAPSPPTQCTDRQTGGKAWHHQGHSYYTCEWYASDKSRCTRFGTHYRNRYVANEACCVCGGGSTAAGVTAPSPPTQCTDRQTGGKAWHHQGHSYYTCEWYASDKSRCTRYGTHYRNRYVANEACCVCGGGDK